MYLIYAAMYIFLFTGKLKQWLQLSLAKLKMIYFKKTKNNNIASNITANFVYSKLLKAKNTTENTHLKIKN